MPPPDPEQQKAEALLAAIVRETKPPRPTIKQAIILAISGLVTAFALLAAAVFFGLLDLYRITGVTTATMITLQSLGIIFGLGLVARKLLKLSWEDLGMVTVPISAIIKAVIIGVLIYFAMVVVIAFIDPTIHQAVRHIFASGLITLPGVIASIVAASFFAPIAEELLFRGVIYRSLDHKWGFWPAALMSSTLFGAMHYHPEHLIWPIATGILGLVLCRMTKIYGSIIPALAFHSVYNFIGISATFWTAAR